jgi:hypothetical protein
MNKQNNSGYIMAGVGFVMLLARSDFCKEEKRK